MKISRSIVFACALLASAGALALDFRTVGAAPAILYDAPSTKAGKQFIIPRGTPLEVVLTYGEWVKVRDMDGGLAWTEAKGLSNKQRNVIIRNANTRVRAAADEASAVVFTADKGVLLELTEPAGNGWTKVRHRDGQGGYVRNTEIWGL